MFRAIGRLIGRRRGDKARRAVADATPVRRSPAAPARHRPGPFEQAVEKLRDLPDGGAGRVRVLSLGEFRAAVGDKWGRLGDKVGILAETIIRANIGPGNLYQRQDEDTWLLAFPATSPEEARRRTVLIAEELSRRLVGDGCIGGTRPLAQAGHVMAAQALGADGGIDRRALRRVLAETSAFLGPGTSAAGLSEGPPRAWGASPLWQPLVFRRNEDQPRDPWRDVPPLPGDTRLAVLWRPTWVADGEAIAAYTARVLRRDGPDQPPREGLLAYPADDPSAALRLDSFVARQGIHGLRQALAAGHAPSVILPLSFSSLAPERRRQLVPPFADLTHHDRQNRLAVEVVRIPDDATAAAVADAVAFLRELCGRVLVRVRLSSALPVRAAALRASGIGLDLTDLEAHERMDDDSLLGVLERLLGSARQAGIDAYLWGARRRRVVGEVVVNGYGMVNGPALMKDVGRPSGTLPAPRGRFAA